MTATDGDVRPGGSTTADGRVPRWAAATPFLLTGLVFASFYVRMPSLKQDYGLDNGELGLMLILPTFTGLLAMQAAGWLVGRFGSAPLVRCAMVALPLTLVGIAVADRIALLVVALLLFGAVDGVIDVSMNAHAVAVERTRDRPIMNGCHAAWSIGGLAGSGAGGLAIAAGLSPTAHYGLVAVALIALGLVAGPRLLPADADRSAPAGAGRTRGAWRAGWTVRVVLLGLTGAIVFITEGSVGNWSGIFLHDELGASLTTASLGYILFTALQTGGRLVGDRLSERMGKGPLVRAAGVVSVIGLAVAVLGQVPAVSIAGFAVLGVGTSVLIPTILSAVGHTGAESGNAAAALARANTLVYTGLLLGPVLVGRFADGFGLTQTLIGLLVLLTVSLAAGLRRV